jgi:hypothetical protein
MRTKVGWISWRAHILSVQPKSSAAEKERMISIEWSDEIISQIKLDDTVLFQQGTGDLEISFNNTGTITSKSLRLGAREIKISVVVASALRAMMELGEERQ